MDLRFINVNYNFLKDNPNYDPAIIDKEYDPDISSEILQIYHKLLWSKEENNIKFYFDRALEYHDDLVLVNRYGSKEEEKIFSSDWIVNDYQHWDRNKCTALKYLDSMDKIILKDFNNIANTIGGRIIFPKREINKNKSINTQRGQYNGKICDRFDITLECIRRFYNGIESIPEFDETLKRYNFFFDLFGKSKEGFKNYCNFFLLQDLVKDDYSEIIYFLDFKDFENNPFPKNVEQYLIFAKNATKFIEARNIRIQEYINCNINNIYD